MTQQRALSGLRVLDLSRLLPGPFATMLLADLGARVDKLEDPGAGDYLRRMPPMVGGTNSAFHALNRGKRSAVLDLKRPEGREALLRLVPRYDVVVESFRPGVMQRLGLPWERLREAHPKLVYCAISGYGQTGPMAGRAGHDLNYVARAGVLGLTGPEDGPPQVPGVQLADIGGGGLYAVAAILAALFERERTGEGTYLDVSMCDGALSFSIFGLMSALGGMQAPRGGDVLAGGIAPYNTYATKDGEAVTLAALEPKFWSAFCAGVGMEPDMAALAPGPHQQELKRTLRELFASRTRDEWVRFGEEHDCCLEPVLRPEEVRDDAHLRARGTLSDEGGPLPMPRSPLGAPDAGQTAPEQGEHTDAVLGDAGLSPDEIAALRDAGVTR